VHQAAEHVKRQHGSRTFEPVQTTQSNEPMYPSGGHGHGVADDAKLINSNRLVAVGVPRYWIAFQPVRRSCDAIKSSFRLTNDGAVRVLTLKHVADARCHAPDTTTMGLNLTRRHVHAPDSTASKALHPAFHSPTTNFLGIVAGSYLTRKSCALNLRSSNLWVRC
jgi:hypothetical protein